MTDVHTTIGLLTLALAGCATSPAEDLAARARDEAALAAGPYPEAAVLVVEGGEVRGADSLADAFATHGADSRFVFRRGEEGERSFTVAYLPPQGIVAGDAFVASLGATLRTRRDGGLELARDLHTLAAADDRTIAVHLSPPDADATVGEVVRVTLDAQAHGALLLPRPLALRLGAGRAAIPGETYVDVVLGRPFSAHRARLRAAVPDLGAEALVEVVYPAPPPEGRP